MDKDDAIVELKDIMQNSYKIPKYQRDFAWTSKNAKELFEDVLAFQNFKHRMGSKDQSRYIFGQIIIYRSSSRTDYIIDGQQRLTTACLLIAAARKVAGAICPSAQVGTPVANFIYKYSPYLYCTTDECKPLLSLSSTNKAYFEAILKTGLAPESKDTSHSNMKQVFETFVISLYNLALGNKTWNEITNYNVLDMDLLLGNNKALQIIDDLLTTFLSFRAVRLVNHNLEEAHRVFETVNARGVRLTGTDLSKNYLFSTCYSNEVALDDDELNLENIWNNAIKSLGNNFTKMFRYALITRVGTITQDEVFDSVKLTFTSPDEIEVFINDFPIFTSVYNAISTKNFVWFNNVETTRILNSLQSVGVSFYCPILMSVVLRAKKEGRDYENEINSIVKAIDCCIVRTIMTGEVNTNALEEPFGKISMDYYVGNISFDQIISDIYSKTNCNDEDVIQKLETVHWNNNKYLRHILTEIFNRHNATVSVPSSADLEHILPKSNANYRHYWPNIDAKEAPLYVDRLGNMVLLSSSINRTIKDHGFDEKLKSYCTEKYSMLDIIPETISDVSEWTFESIDIRTKKLAKLIVGTWKIPNA